MIFTEFRFLAFFLIVFCVYWALQNHQYRKFWLLVCSYIFYAAWDWRFLSLMMISTVIDYSVGLMLFRPTEEDATNQNFVALIESETARSSNFNSLVIDRQTWIKEQTQIGEKHPEVSTIVKPSPLNDWWTMVCSKPLRPEHRTNWLLVSLVGNLGILGIFKYYNFFAESAVTFSHFLGLTLSFSSLQIILPVGISFYTFQTLSYSLDIHRGKLKPTDNFLDFALFVSFFPQLVAGPIVRASVFLPQLLTPKALNQVDIRGCLMLFLGGFIKKACISDNLSFFSDRYFADPEIYTAATAWLAIIFFTIQVYCDFAGYSDMAIASAGLLGYKLPVNFKFPYFASSITELWKRWHITMSTWFRDYLFIPLMQRREREKRTRLFSYSALVFTMLVTGLWHGASWNFVVWGGLNGLALVVHREWTNLVTPYEKVQHFSNFLGIPLTFYWFCAAGTFFRSTSLHKDWISFKAFILFQSSGSQNLQLELAWILLPLTLVYWSIYKGWWPEWWRTIPNWGFTMCYGVFVLTVLPSISMVYQPFIYFQF